MTVKELIEKLSTYPADLRVIVTGYEDGYNDISIFEENEIALDIHTDWYYGQHADASDEFFIEKVENPRFEKALLIEGKNLLSKGF